VYQEFMLKLVQDVRRRGRTAQVWADMLLRYPDLVGEVPKDLIALVWGYEADSPLMQRCALLRDAGLAFYVCPGTSSWLSIAGRTQNALANIKQAAQAGLRYGAEGCLITDWGDLGHWQQAPVNLLGYAAGASDAWCLQSAESLDLAQALSLHAFGDATGEMGRLAYGLGDIYLLTGKPMVGISPLFWILTNPLRAIAQDPDLSHGEPTRVLDALADLRGRLGQARPLCADAQLLTREWELTIRLLEHACHRWLLARMDNETAQACSHSLRKDLAEIKTEFESIWRLRNRVGGLADSLSRLETVGESYAT
jgi:hypothetical protein